MTTKSDSQIQTDVLNELKWDTRVDETEVGVQVKNAVVTLVGNVGSYARKIAAQQAAHRVAGVLDVANDLKVKVAGTNARTDTDIAQAVRRALEWDAFVPDERIRSTVENGWVILDGSVDLLREREDAESAVSNLLGVLGVTNRIIIKAPLPKPARLRDKIEEALERHAQRQADVEAERLRIDVDANGTVTLFGTVRSWSEDRAVVGAVSHAPGVQSVKDMMRINPYG